MAIIQDWKIRSTEARCEVTGDAFVDEEEFFTSIFEDPETDGFIRRDYSVSSWKEAKSSFDPAPFSFWKSTYKAPVAVVEEEKFEDTSAEGILRRLIDENEKETENARYILAVMLERKKTLVPTDVQETETRRILFYEHAENADVFIVVDPQLRLEEIEAVQREVADLLEKEENRTRPVASEPTGEEALAENSEDDEDESNEEGEKPEESEDEPVTLAGEEASDRV